MVANQHQQPNVPSNCRSANQAAPTNQSPSQGQQHAKQNQRQHNQQTTTLPMPVPVSARQQQQQQQIRTSDTNLLSPNAALDQQQQQQQQRRRSTLSAHGFFIDYSCTRRRSSARANQFCDPAQRDPIQAAISRNKFLRNVISPARRPSTMVAGSMSSSVSNTNAGSPLGRARSKSNYSGAGSTNLLHVGAGARMAGSRRTSIFDPTGHSLALAASATRRKSTMVVGTTGDESSGPAVQIVPAIEQAATMLAVSRQAAALQGKGTSKSQLVQRVPVIGCSPTSIRASLAALEDTRRYEKLLRKLKRHQKRKEKERSQMRNFAEKRAKKNQPDRFMCDINLLDDGLNSGTGDEFEDAADNDSLMSYNSADRETDEESNTDGNRRRASKLSLRRKSIRAFKEAANLLNKGSSLPKSGDNYNYEARRRRRRSSRWGNALMGGRRKRRQHQDPFVDGLSISSTLSFASSQTSLPSLERYFDNLSLYEEEEEEEQVYDDADCQDDDVRYCANQVHTRLGDRLNVDATYSRAGPGYYSEGYENCASSSESVLSFQEAFLKCNQTGSIRHTNELIAGVATHNDNDKNNNHDDDDDDDDDDDRSQKSYVASGETTKGKQCKQESSLKGSLVGKAMRKLVAKLGAGNQQQQQQQVQRLEQRVLSPKLPEVKIGSDDRQASGERLERNDVTSARPRPSQPEQSEPLPATSLGPDRQVQARQRRRSISVSGGLNYWHYYYYLRDNSLDAGDELPLSMTNNLFGRAGGVSGGSTAAGIVSTGTPMDETERRARLYVNYSLARLDILNCRSDPVAKLAEKLANLSAQQQAIELKSGQPNSPAIDYQEPIESCTSPATWNRLFDFSQSTDEASLTLSTSSTSFQSSSTSRNSSSLSSPVSTVSSSMALGSTGRSETRSVRCPAIINEAAHQDKRLHQDQQSHSQSHQPTNQIAPDFSSQSSSNSAGQKSSASAASSSASSSSSSSSNDSSSNVQLGVSASSSLYWRPPFENPPPSMSLNNRVHYNRAAPCHSVSSHSVGSNCVAVTTDAFYTGRPQQSTTPTMLAPIDNHYLETDRDDYGAYQFQPREELTGRTWHEENVRNSARFSDALAQGQCYEPQASSQLNNKQSNLDTINDPSASGQDGGGQFGSRLMHVSDEMNRLPAATPHRCQAQELPTERGRNKGHDETDDDFERFCRRNQQGGQSPTVLHRPTVSQRLSLADTLVSGTQSATPACSETSRFGRDAHFRFSVKATRGEWRPRQAQVAARQTVDDRAWGLPIAEAANRRASRTFLSWDQLEMSPMERPESSSELAVAPLRLVDQKSSQVQASRNSSSMGRGELSSRLRDFSLPVTGATATKSTSSSGNTTAQATNAARRFIIGDHPANRRSFRQPKAHRLLSLGRRDEAEVEPPGSSDYALSNSSSWRNGGWALSYLVSPSRSFLFQRKHSTKTPRETKNKNSGGQPTVKQRQAQSDYEADSQVNRRQQQVDNARKFARPDCFASQASDVESVKQRQEANELLGEFEAQMSEAANLAANLHKHRHDRNETSAGPSGSSPSSSVRQRAEIQFGCGRGPLKGAAQVSLHSSQSSSASSSALCSAGPMSELQMGPDSSHNAVLASNRQHRRHFDCKTQPKHQAAGQDQSRAHAASAFNLAPGFKEPTDACGQQTNWPPTGASSSSYSSFHHQHQVSQSKQMSSCGSPNCALFAIGRSRADSNGSSSNASSASAGRFLNEPNNQHQSRLQVPASWPAATATSCSSEALTSPNELAASEHYQVQQSQHYVHHRPHWSGTTNNDTALSTTTTCANKAPDLRSRSRNNDHNRRHVHESDRDIEIKSQNEPPVHIGSQSNDNDTNSTMPNEFRITEAAMSWFGRAEQDGCKLHGSPRLETASEQNSSVRIQTGRHDGTFVAGTRERNNEQLYQQTEFTVHDSSLRVGNTDPDQDENGLPRARAYSTGARSERFLDRPNSGGHMRTVAQSAALTTNNFNTGNRSMQTLRSHETQTGAGGHLELTSHEKNQSLSSDAPVRSSSASNMNAGRIANDLATGQLDVVETTFVRSGSCSSGREQQQTQVIEVDDDDQEQIERLKREEENRSIHLHAISMLRRNSFNCTVLGARQTGKRTIVICFVKLLNEFKLAADEYKKEKMLSKLVECSERLQEITSKQEEQEQQLLDEQKRLEQQPRQRRTSRLNSWLPGGERVKNLLNLAPAGKRRLHSVANLWHNQQSSSNIDNEQQQMVTLSVTEDGQKHTTIKEKHFVGQNRRRYTTTEHLSSVEHRSRSRDNSKSFVSSKFLNVDINHREPTNLITSINKSDTNINYRTSDRITISSNELRNFNSQVGGENQAPCTTAHQLQVPCLDSTALRKHSDPTTFRGRQSCSSNILAQRDRAPSCVPSILTTRQSRPSSGSVFLTTSTGEDNDNNNNNENNNSNNNDHDKNSADRTNSPSQIRKRLQPETDQYAGLRQRRCNSRAAFDTPIDDSCGRQTTRSSIIRRPRRQSIRMSCGSKRILLSLKDLNRRKFAIKFNTRRQLSDTYLEQLRACKNSRLINGKEPSRKDARRSLLLQLARSTALPDAFLVVYSINDRNSFDYAKSLIKQLRSSQGDIPLPIVLVANKSDLERNREVKIEDGRSLAKNYACKFIEISCTIGYNLDTLLVGLRTQLVLRHHIILSSILRPGFRYKQTDNKCSSDPDTKPPSRSSKTNSQRGSFKERSNDEEKRMSKMSDKNGRDVSSSVSSFKSPKSTNSDNILVRFYKRYVMDSYEQSTYDCDNFSKL